MKKRRLLVSLLSAAALFGVSTTILTSCDDKNDNHETPEVQKFTITIDLDNGTTPFTKDVVKGEKLTGVETPTKEGYKFIGWKANGESWTMDEAITADITIVAQWEENQVVTPVKEYWTVTIDLDNGTTPTTKKVEKGQKLTGVANPTKDGYTFTGWKANGADWTMDTAITADITIVAQWSPKQVEPVKEYWTVTIDLDNGTTPTTREVEKGQKLTGVADPTKDGYTFAGWKVNGADWTMDEAITADITIVAQWTPKQVEPVKEYWTVTIDLDNGSTPTTKKVEKGQKLTGVADPTKDGYTFAGWKANGVDWTMDEAITADITIVAQWTSKQLEPVKEYFTVTIDLDNGTTPTTKKVEKGQKLTGVAAPTKDGYTFTGWKANGVNWTMDEAITADITIVAQWTPKQIVTVEETGFEIVSYGIVNFLTGQEYDSSKLQLKKIYKNGTKEVLDITDADVVIDSNFNSNVSGEYTISVQYKDFEAQTFTVKVYELQSIRLGFNATEKIGNSAAGNGVYFNQTVKRVYALNSELDCSYLSLTVVIEFNGTIQKYLFGADDYEINSNAFDSSTPGKKTITVTIKGTSVSATYDVYVVSTEPSVVNDVVQIKVDGAYEGEVGAVVDEFNCFVTIQQALDYLENLGKTYDSKKKLIVLAAGTYKEKLEITIPNIEIRGAGRDVTKIEWDSLYGIPDESGFEQITDSCSTFNVRDKANNMTITDVTISNYWNSLEVFNRDLGANYPEHRALALLVQADQFVMKNCKLLGYQDTVEFFTGRQYLENTYISGTTDFIFGTNNTTYFKNCQIHSITNGQIDGGYITAFKGCNKGSGDYITYGAIFDGCHFTADADVVKNKNTSIGRCWDAYAAVMVMNSELDAHISTKPFNNSNKNQRWVSMNADPTDPTVKFFEYNNTGAGSIQTSISGVTVLTDATQAAKYANYSIIFGAQNGKVVYNNAWNPTSATPEEDTNIYFNFNPSKESPTGTNYTVNTNLSLSSSGTSTLVLGGGMTLDATKGNIAYNANSGCVNLKTGAKVKFHVEANTSVVITTYPDYHPYTINGVATVNDTFIRYFEKATDVEIISTGDLYLAQIVLRLNQQAPAAAVVESITLKDPKTEFTVGDNFTVGDLKVLATYSDGSLVELTEYDVNHSINNSVAGTYEVTISVGNVSKSYNVIYEAADADSAITKTTTLDFTVDGGYDNSRVNYANANISRNGDNSSFIGTIIFDVKAGAIIWVIPYKTYGHFTIGTLGEKNLAECTAPKKYVATSDCTIAVTGNSGNYIAQIGISYPVTESITYTFRTDGDAENKVTQTFNGVHGYTDIFYVDASTGKLQSREGQWALFNDTTKIRFIVAAGATVTITCYTTDYSVNGTAATTKTTTITCDSETEIEIIATANGYIDTIQISFA